jgi:hypothetical protein
MKNDNVTSLRRFRAQRFYDGYRMLPRSQRTSARSALLLEAIFEYAYEHVPRHRLAAALPDAVDADEARRISRRLEEFIPSRGRGQADPIMSWLHDNLVPEAWIYTEDIRNVVRDILRET